MTGPQSELDLQELRRRAVERLEGRHGKLAEMPIQDVQALVHELEIHQVELEVQNEELRRVQLELAEALTRYRDLFDRAPVGYLTLNAKSEIVQANQAAAQLCSRERDALEGRRVETLVLRDDRDKLFLLLKSTAASGLPQAGEFRLDRPTGRARWVRADFSPLVPNEDDSGGYRLTLTDVTGRVAAEEVLREVNEHLEQMVRQRTAELAHRAKQLQQLTSELTMAEQRERQRMAAMLHDGLQQILTAAKYSLLTLERSADLQVAKVAKHVIGMLSDAITDSRSLTAELSPPILREGDLVAGLEWLATWMKDKHGLAVSLQAQNLIGELSEVTTILLFQATRELLFNVVKHAGVRAAKIEVSLRDGSVRIIVTDQGKGFDAAKIRARGGGAGGFGLFSISERIGMLDGKIEIESTPGQGSRFTMTVPVGVPVGGERTPVGAARVSAAFARREAGTKQGQIRIVLVDDHIMMRQGVTQLLRNEPDVAVVGEASDGESALSLVRKLRPDVVLMDVSMPGMNGIEATRLIRAEMPEVQVVGLSMYEEAERAQAMLDVGASSYVAKTAPADELVAAIRSCV